MDHFYQLPALGDPDQIMFECYTLLAALSQQTSRVLLGAMVTGNTYRNPTLLAKIVSTLDVVSSGRAMLNIGAGWFEREHVDLGFEFGSFKDRFEKLEEAVRVIAPMLRGEVVSFEGVHYSVRHAVNNPAPLGRVPVMIGGSGEQKTLRMVAAYADHGNLTCERHEVPRKVEALAEHCARLGRDRSDVTLSWLRRVCVAPTFEQAREDLWAFLGARGLDRSALSDDDAAVFEANFVLGDPDQVAEVLRSDLSLGIDGYVLSLVANGHIEGRVELLGQAGRAALADR